jgi:hypothetical protein
MVRSASGSCFTYVNSGGFSGSGAGCGWPEEGSSKGVGYDLWEIDHSSNGRWEWSVESLARIRGKSEYDEMRGVE